LLECKEIRQKQEKIEKDFIMKKRRNAKRKGVVGLFLIVTVLLQGCATAKYQDGLSDKKIELKQC